MRKPPGRLAVVKGTPPDPYVVELLVHGEPVSGRVAPKERRAAALVLTDQGWSAARISERVKVSTRTVVRARARRRTGG